MYSQKLQAPLPAQSRTHKVVPLVRTEIASFDDVVEDLREILQSDILSNFGPYNAAFEHSLASFTGAKYALAVANATSGLMLLLQTLPRGSEVILPSFTFIATLQAVLWNGLIPVFADIDADTLCLDPACIPGLVTPRTSAILAVHTFGMPCAIEELSQLSREFGLRLFFDSAHALGSRHAGQRIGGFGDAEVFSFSATKLVSCGEGGMVCTNDESIFRQLLETRDYGQSQETDDCKLMGLNAKLSELQALLGLRGLPKADWIVERRNAIAAEYRHRLSHFDFLKFQEIAAGDLSTYKDFVLIINDERISRNQLVCDLQKQGVGAASYFDPPMHLTTIGKPYNRNSLPNTEFVSSNILSIPVYSSLSDAELDYVCSMLENLLIR